MGVCEQDEILNSATAEICRIGTSWKPVEWHWKELQSPGKMTLKDSDSYPKIWSACWVWFWFLRTFFCFGNLILANWFSCFTRFFFSMRFTRQRNWCHLSRSVLKERLRLQRPSNVVLFGIVASWWTIRRTQLNDALLRIVWGLQLFGAIWNLNWNELKYTKIKEPVCQVYLISFFITSFIIIDIISWITNGFLAAWQGSEVATSMTESFANHLWGSLANRRGLYFFQLL